MGNNRFYIHIEKHIGIGVRWDTTFYMLQVSIAIPFITICVGIGKEKA